MPASLNPRESCLVCRRASTGCICPLIRTFSWEPRLVLLVHPQEARNRVGTARIIRLSLPETMTIVATGEQLDQDAGFRALIEDPTMFPVVLYPGRAALDLSAVFQRSVQRMQTLRQALRPEGRRLAIVVVDGTWSQARKMVRNSRLLGGLPQLSLRPERGSAYRIRRQPARHCLSTVECVHAVIERLGELGVYDLPVGRAHDSLLDVFRRIVEIQLSHGAQEISNEQIAYYSGRTDQSC